MWDFFIKNDKFSYLFLVILIVIGGYSLVSIPRESAPEVVVPVGIVNTLLPGAPALDVETLVTNEIERGLSTLENVTEISSVSREGVSTITVEFDAAADVDASIRALKDEIDRIKPELPENAEDPVVSDVDFQNQPIITIVVAGNLSDHGFATLADQVEAELEALPGVSRAEVRGARDPEIQVIADQKQLAKFGLRITDLTAAIAAHNQTLPVGSIKNNGVIYNLAFEGEVSNVNEIANIPIINRGGQPVYIRDVATVIDGLSAKTSLSRLSVLGTPSQNAVTFNVYKQRGGDVTKIAAAVDTHLATLTEPGALLDGFSVETLLDAGEQIRNDLLQLTTSGLQTVVLVVLLLVITIGWREGLLAGLAIPLSFLFGFIGLYFSGNSINFLSLFSLILGVGILVDSAIVMVEGINRRLKDDPTIDKRAAAIAAIKEFTTPLTAGTLTTVSMFVGLFIVSGVIGQFIKSIPFTIIFLLLASLFVALAIIPLLAVSFLKRRNTTTFEQKQTAYAQLLETWYRKKLATLLTNEQWQKRFIWFLRISLVVALMLPVVGVVKVIFFEQTDTDFIVIEIEEPQGTTKEETDIVVRRVEDILYTEPDIDSFAVTVGSGSEFGSGGTGEHLANIFVSLTDERTRSSSEIVTTLRTRFTSFNDTTITVNQPSEGPPVGPAIVLKFLGDDLTRLTEVANEAAQLLKTVPHVTNIDTSTNNNGSEFVLNFKRNEAARFGLNPRTVSGLLRTAVYGADATSITTLTDDIDVVVKLNLNTENIIDPERTNETTIDTLERISIPTPSGEYILLGSIVDISLRESSSVINHADQERVVSVTADVTSDGNAREAQAAAVALIKSKLDLTGITLSTGGGETEESNQAFLEMGIALIVGVLLMVAVLTLQFNSYLHTRYVLTILPYSLIGIFAGLALTNSSLSFPSMMGFIALSGIVVNNSILLIDNFNQQRKHYPHKDMYNVVLDGASSRLRPILLTTLTTVIGMVPLTLAGDLWAPLAYAVMFGLLFSVVITLILIPVIYYRKPGNVQR